MPTQNKYSPRVFLTYANHKDDLGNVIREQRSLKALFEPNHDLGNLLTLETYNVTSQNIRDTFNKEAHQGNIVLWHYSGHAEGYHLLLHNGRLHGGGLDQFLKLQNGLHLVFLNACSTLDQAKPLAKKIPVVIATSEDVEDAVAYEFAEEFYKAINAFETIEKAFAKAKSRILMDYGDYRTNRQSLQRILRGSIQTNKYSTPIHDFWELLYAHKADIQWTLQTAIGNPYLGIPGPVLDAPFLPDDPFVSLKPYTHKEAKLFFGRGWEIRKLYHFIKNEQSPPVLLLMGQSGVGKSSLLQAGLLPRLRQHYQVKYIRRNASKGILHAFRQIFPDLASLETGDVLGTWKGYEYAHQKPLVLILDQLEEIFTKPLEGEEVLSSEQELEALLTIIKQVFLDPQNKPKGRVILSYRKEHSPEIEDKIKRLEVPNHQFLLFPFQEANLKEVIEGIGSTKQLRDKYQIVCEGELAQLIANDLLTDKGSPVAPMLQILLAKMWEATKHQLPRKFDKALYSRLKSEGLHLRDFLKQQLTKITQDTAFAPFEANGLALDVLYFHTTSWGTADTQSFDDILERYEGTSEEGESTTPRLDWNAFIELLVKLRLLAGQGDGSTSLGHDTLASLVMEAYHNSEKEGQRATQVLESTLKNKVPKPASRFALFWQKISKGLSQSTKEKDETQPIYLDRLELKIVEKGTEGMRKQTGEEEDLIRRSKKRRKQEKSVRYAAAFAFLFFPTVFYFYDRYRLWEKEQAQLNLSMIKAQMIKARQQKKKLDASLMKTKKAQAGMQKSLDGVKYKKAQLQDSLERTKKYFLSTQGQLTNAQTTKKALDLAIEANKLRNEAIVLRSSFEKKTVIKAKTLELLEDALRLAKAAYRMDKENSFLNIKV